MLGGILVVTLFATGDLDRPAALLEFERGRLDVADHLAAPSVRRWDGISPVGHATSLVVLATIHVRAGERGSLGLTDQAITKVGQLNSVRVRRQLQPLAEVLDTWPGTDTRDLARAARQIATIRM